MPDANFETLSGNGVGENPNSSPWAETEMNVRSETTTTSSESEKNEPSLADRIRSEMTLQEIEKLDIQNLSDEDFAAVEERIKQFDETGNAGPIKNETELPPKVQELKSKAVDNIAFKSATDNLLKDTKEVLTNPKRLIALGATAALAAGFAIGGYMVGKGLHSEGADSGIKDEQYENSETEIGIKDGYGEKGMYLSKNKPSELAFGSAVEVAEECDGDECEMVKYTAENQVESMASYLAHLPEQLQPEGFKGLTIAEAEQKLESLSDEEYEKVQKEFNEAIDQAFTRRIKVEGQRANVLMDKKDASGNVNYGNMEAVQCETYENATMLQLFWTKDNNANSSEIGSMILKIIYDDEGNIIGGCIQPLDELDSQVLGGLPNKQDNPNNPEKGDKEEDEKEDDGGGGGGGGSDAKNPEAIKKNMQTGDETTNKVSPTGPGKQENRPDTSKDSYKEENKNKEETKEKAKEQPSDSNSGGTVGDKIQNADQGESSHETRTEEQITEVKKEEQDQKTQRIANETAETVDKNKDNGMTDFDAAAQLQKEIGG